MVKHKTLNNFKAREIIRCACSGNYRSVYMYLYNFRDDFTDEIYHRICTLVGELAPLTLEIYKSLPYEVQNHYNQLWINYCNN